MRIESKMKNRQESTAANRFIGDYDTVRPLLRYISYGCYHKSFLVERLGQSARAYEENMARLRAAIADVKAGRNLTEHELIEAD